MNEFYKKQIERIFHLCFCFDRSFLREEKWAKETLVIGLNKFYILIKIGGYPSFFIKPSPTQQTAPPPSSRRSLQGCFAPLANLPRRGMQIFFPPANNIIPPARSAPFLFTLNSKKHPFGCLFHCSSFNIISAFLILPTENP